MNSFEQREQDWRNGPIVYQAIVDRFAPAQGVDAKRDRYAAPRVLRGWEERPARGRYLEAEQVWSHELEFWGGDLVSLRGRLDHLQRLGVDVLYLNPIHQAFTNHKYDAEDYFAVSPELGTRADVRALADALHEAGIRLVLDGVFNHVGRRAPWFERAQAGAEPERGWFFLGEDRARGYRCWADAANLPELRLEEPGLRERLWGAPDSVVQGYLREEGVDGWRLDVAFDLGPALLAELTAAAHAAKPGSLTVGEVYNMPTRWIPALDAVMNMTARELILRLARGELSARLAARHLATLVADVGLERLLKCWLVLDNHDTPRLATALPEAWQRELAQTLQFTLPGAPQLYYGVEAGLPGGDDPENRAPMPWADAAPGNPEYDRLARLIALRRRSRALRVGEFVPLETERALAFMRRTDRVRETVVVVANPEVGEVVETLLLRDSWLMDGRPLRDEQTGETFAPRAAVLRLPLPPRSVRVLTPVVEETVDYSPYKRVP